MAKKIIFTAHIGDWFDVDPNTIECCYCEKPKARLRYCTFTVNVPVPEGSSPWLDYGPWAVCGPMCADFKAIELTKEGIP